MKYVLNTVKELIILSGMYFFINLGLSVGIPLLIGYLLSDKSVPLPIGGMTLIMSFVYIVFFFFGKTDMVEYKSKQMTYALPSMMSTLSRTRVSDCMVSIFPLPLSYLSR